MRKRATLLVLCVLATPAFAAKLLSIDQVEQLLSKLEGKPDGKVAGELDAVQLTERVSPARLAKWEATFPGARTHDELMRLADLSAFQNPPVDDLLRDPEPDAATQVQILTQAAKYVRATMARLPDFFASRDTTHFESLISQRLDYSVGSPGAGGVDEHESLGSISLKEPRVDTLNEIEAVHLAGQFSATVTYRNGHEEPDEAKQKKEPRIGLTSSGEFGPILAVVLGDALQSKIGWLRWEQGASEPEAVFQFSVPEGKSHFAVNISEGGQTLTLAPAYHGEIEIDPATGEILRLSEIADMTSPHAGLLAAILVEFAPVTIAGRTVICPVHGVAFSRFPAPNAAPGPTVPLQTELNDVAFTHYHELRSEVQILANNAAGGNGNAPAVSATPPAAAAATATPESASAPAATPAAPVTPAEATAANAAPAATSPAAAPVEAPASPAADSSPAPAAPAESAATAPLSPTSAPATPAPDAAIARTTTSALPSGAVLESNAQLVLVDVVVTDHGRPVAGLSRDRFHIDEDGHEQPIASFEELKPAAKTALAEPPVLPAGTYSNVPTYPETGSVNVLLLDALNTPSSDQEQVRRAMIAYLGSIRPGSPLAIFTLSSRLRMAAGFTTDVAQLLKALQGERAKPQSASGVGSGRSSDMSADLEQAASSINTNGDPGTIWLASQIMQFAADMKAYDTNQRAAMTLEAFSELARYLAAIPGRKNVIWLSGSFPIGLSPDANLRTPASDLRDNSLDMERTSVLLAAARVAVYPVDARGVLMAPTAGSTSVPPPAFPSPEQPLEGDATDTAVSRENQVFGVQTAQEKDTMNAIAQETGGHVYSTGNDLRKAMAEIVATDSSYYALSYVPPQRKTGARGPQFHSIAVKVDGGYQLAYRRGYYANEAAAPVAGAPGSAPAPMLAAALPGAPPATQILFEARVLPESDAQPDSPATGAALAAGPASATADALKPAHRYGVDLNIDPQSLTFSESADGSRRAQLECALVAFDPAGKQRNSLARTLDVNLSAQQFAQMHAEGKTIPVHLALDLPAGEIALRMIVYDTASARTGSLEIPVAVSAGSGR